MDVEGLGCQLDRALLPSPRGEAEPHALFPAWSPSTPGVAPLTSPRSPGTMEAMKTPGRRVAIVAGVVAVGAIVPNRLKILLLGRSAGTQPRYYL